MRWRTDIKYKSKAQWRKLVCVLCSMFISRHWHWLHGESQVGNFSLSSSHRRCHSSSSTLHHVQCPCILRARFSFFQLTKYLSHRQLFVFIFVFLSFCSFLSHRVPLPTPFAVRFAFIMCIFRWEWTMPLRMRGTRWWQSANIKITHIDSKSNERASDCVCGGLRTGCAIEVPFEEWMRPLCECAFLIVCVLRWCGWLCLSINCCWQIQEGQEERGGARIGRSLGSKIAISTEISYMYVLTACVRRRRRHTSVCITWHSRSKCHPTMTTMRDDWLCPLRLHIRNGRMFTPSHSKF